MDIDPLLLWRWYSTEISEDERREKKQEIMDKYWLSENELDDYMDKHWISEDDLDDDFCDTIEEEKEREERIEEIMDEYWMDEDEAEEYLDESNDW